VDRFFAQHIARWSDTATPSLFVDPRNQQFYRELARELSRRRWLLCTVVEFDDEPVAFHYGFDYNGAVLWYKPSFNRRYARMSPGLVLVRHLIGYAIQESRHELDFTIGDEPFKGRFTNTTRKTLRFRVFRDPLRFLYESVKQKLYWRLRGISRYAPDRRRRTSQSNNE
jgi:CelD/BcsL family acetyltransferase involved in cellulose biosynthesis